MSLLLDALKKSGSGQNGQQDTGKTSELTLEDLPPKSASASPAEAPGNNLSAARSASENLFTAKKVAPKKFRYNLGIVPTAIIIGVVLGTAGSIYVWYEIQPPNSASYKRPVTTTAAPTPPTTVPPPVIQQVPAPAPMQIPTPAMASTSSNLPATTEAVATRDKGNKYVFARPRTVKPSASTEDSPAGNLQIQRKSEPDDLYTILMSAYRFYEKGDLTNAWQRYREVLIRDPKNRDALLGMAAIAQQQKQDEVAHQYYRQVLALDPRDPVANAGMAAFTSGDASSRESRLKFSLAQSPNSAALYFSLGNLYTDQSRWSEAQEAYFNAFRLEPGNAQLAFCLATSLDHLGQKRTAAQYYRQALQLDSGKTAGFDHEQTEKRLQQLNNR